MTSEQRFCSYALQERGSALRELAGAGLAPDGSQRGNVNMHLHSFFSYNAEGSYAQPLTLELADRLTPFLQKYDSFIMENRGLVTMTRGDIYWTLLTVGLFEATVDSMLRALSVGALKELDRKAVRDLSNVMIERNLPLFGAPGVNATLESMYFG